MDFATKATLALLLGMFVGHVLVVMATSGAKKPLYPLYFIVGVVMIGGVLAGCASKANEAYYEPEVYEENYGPYQEECYCKGPDVTEVQTEDQR